MACQSRDRHRQPAGVCSTRNIVVISGGTIGITCRHEYRPHGSSPLPAFGSLPRLLYMRQWLGYSRESLVPWLGRQQPSDSDDSFPALGFSARVGCLRGTPIGIAKGADEIAGCIAFVASVKVAAAVSKSDDCWRYRPCQAFSSGVDRTDFGFFVFLRFLHLLALFRVRARTLGPSIRLLLGSKSRVFSPARDRKLPKETASCWLGCRCILISESAA